MPLSLGILAGLLVMFIWGLNDYLQSVPIKSIGSLKAMFIGSMLNLVFTVGGFCVCLYLGKAGLRMEEIVLLLLAGVVDIAAIYYFNRAFELGEVSVVSPITSAFPLITVALAVAFLGERLGFLQLLSIVLIVAGVILTSSDLSKLRHLHTVNGVRESIFTLVLYGVYFFIVGMLKKTMDPIRLFTFTGFAVILIGLPFIVMRGGVLKKEDFRMGRMIWMLVFVNILYNVAWGVYNYAISVELTSVVTTVSALYPVVAVILAVMLLKERLASNQKIGIAVTMVGLILIGL